MARGTKVKTGRTRVPVREEKRPVVTAAQPAGFDMPRAQPPRFSDFEADTELSNALAAFEPEAVEPEQEAEELGYTPTVYTQTISSQDYGAAPTYETPDEALSHYNALLEEVQQQQAQTASVYNYNNYDPGDFARAGFSGPSSVGGQAAADRIAEYLRENDIPPSIEVDGQTLYFTTGVGENALAQTLGDDYSASGSYDVYGTAGTYSTVYTPPEGVFAGLNPYLRAALGVATGGLSEGFISATNIISGEADTSDFINVALSGVNLAQQSGSGGFTASSGSPITGTTAPRTLAEMAEAGDIVSIGAGSVGVAEEQAEEDSQRQAQLAAIEAARLAQEEEARRRAEEQAAAEAARAAAQAAAEQAERDRIAAERAAQEEADAAAALEQERLAREAEAERQRQQQIADEQAEAARVAEEQRIAAERAAQAEAARQAAAAAEAQRRAEAEAARIAEEARIAA